ncbi:MAG: class II fumarate hydratase [Acidimicrobiia bacterium]|nr:class II fumarate hydratase [Acidimicrobiia bacterium]
MRIERDSMGEVVVPDHARWGASTQRALDNFPTDADRAGVRFIHALGMIKAEAARANAVLGVVEAATADAIATAADEVAAGLHDGQVLVGGSLFVTGLFQSGSGTSMNMNANEVIAHRAAEIGGGIAVHPNDHVNASQSSNDVIPTAIHLAASIAATGELLPALQRLAASLHGTSVEFDGVIKSGRTHLMDATPVRLGQEFGGYAAQVRKAVGRLEGALPDLWELALGGTAVGTGINAPAGFAATVIRAISARTGLPFREAGDHFEAQAAKDAAVQVSGTLKTAAVSLFKIANDLRWLASGPSGGIGEIGLPSLQPGSSIMPGKVNPVIPEAVMQAAAQVIGNDTAITWGGANGNLELNVMMPLIARNLLESIGLVAVAADLLAAKCVDGITVDAARAADLVGRNVIIVTALAPRIGYDLAATVAKRAAAEGRSVREVALEMRVLPEAELDAALDLYPMTEGGLPG